VYVLAKRALEMAAWFAARRGDAGIGPQHLLYGVLCDARDPLGTHLSRRSRRQLASLGLAPDGPAGSDSSWPAWRAKTRTAPSACSLLSQSAAPPS
jgi:hypothetical protein